MLTDEEIVRMAFPQIMDRFFPDYDRHKQQMRWSVDAKKISGKVSFFFWADEQGGK